MFFILNKITNIWQKVAKICRLIAKMFNRVKNEVIIHVSVESEERNQRIIGLKLKWRYPRVGEDEKLRDMCVGEIMVGRAG
ncbi:hypothetical protein GBL98_01795 [Yersinia pseudotuberculosis]|nr:hypothetical protein EGX44_07985 [Yersinia pseudotuberculosis]MBO1605286.1 hypothetical protein [Yersinia pseudotuberculosis]MBO1609439.1 hypothetical protein [Yersinia pseudotuberculosis]MBO1619896.1 hypothetical protein [Yersinia pseudotuberculosis]PSH17831.1 hypothetical protein B7R75_00810 [Yersinia pseudotuberculosis]